MFGLRLLTRPLSIGWPRLIPRRNYDAGYKLREETRWRENLEVLARKDVTLFHYENPTRMALFNGVAAALGPLWVYLGSFAYGLASKMDPYREKMAELDQSPMWILDNVDQASRGVGTAFCLFGLSLSTYWLLRSRHTVRRLILRKGGKLLTIVTYGFVGTGSKTITLPVTQCAAVHQKFQGKRRMFITVNDYYFKFQLNVEKGTFLNKPLFDRTVGISKMV
ncbi:hypothetical protein TCAL_04387 [Tigriopus californicus]|uniref:Transmembrane protein 223 n=2 Tax=Tigriopus californicus TaxID=6832 RepID=A0A553N8X3_TIGCA|nr:hypothetical protein TCAL_04387 [Tigriopus californicus]|eukprot:TCALIF_04387-PA protein Name:"Similar to tmem223 Transmembrane protein 223 (Danio rerio)" AED:0.00 eAED:0.00 QI:377/1/1/1/1/1/3/82/221